MKKCLKCLIYFEKIFFSKNAKSSDGTGNWCKSCVKIYQKENRKAINDTTKKWYGRNSEKVNKRIKEKRSKNLDKYKIYMAAYQKANPGKMTAIARKRELAKIRRTPPWLTHGDWMAMEELYKHAAALTKVTGVKYEVDHIIPLQGKNISGLHVLSNLQILSRSDNRQKSNTFKGN